MSTDSQSHSNVPYEPDLQGHIPVLDGLRGIAILMVVVFHTTRLRATAPADDLYFMFGRSAWIGVDLFFVLSGFLITGILYDTKTHQGFFKNFYARRILRIFPLYYLVVGFAIFIGTEIDFFSPAHVPDPRPRQWWYWLYLSNFLAAKERLGHLILGPTWSLAIEEQFYLVWPLLVYLLPRTGMMGVCLLCSGVALGLRIYLFYSGVHSSALYVLTPTRLDPLAIGSFIALAVRGKGGVRACLRWGYLVLVASGAGVAYLLSQGLLNKKLPEMILFGYSTVALFFGAALLCLIAVRPDRLFIRLLTIPALLLFGKLSYALYLFNRPLVNVVESYLFHYRSFPRWWGSSIPGQVIFTLLVIATSLLLAYCSWHIFEKHFLKLKRYFPSHKREFPLTAPQAHKRPEGCLASA